jgi:hypothetical protein
MIGGEPVDTLDLHSNMLLVVGTSPDKEFNTKSTPLPLVTRMMPLMNVRSLLENIWSSATPSFTTC